MSLEFYVAVQLLIDTGGGGKREKKCVRVARNNVVSCTFFYRPIYYNQKNERRENISRRIRSHITARNAEFKWLMMARELRGALDAATSTASVPSESFILAFSIHIYYQRTLLHFFECDLS